MEQFAAGSDHVETRATDLPENAKWFTNPWERVTQRAGPETHRDRQTEFQAMSNQCGLMSCYVQHPDVPYAQDAPN
ncbi:uncharacterized protein ACNS7B_017972 isoform 3-T4 [Menidia menidia]